MSIINTASDATEKKARCETESASFMYRWDTLGINSIYLQDESENNLSRK
jgi:hypothetical protein